MRRIIISCLICLSAPEIMAQKVLTDPVVLICGSDEMDLWLKDLKECSTISIDNPNFKVSAYVFSYTINKGLLEVPVHTDKFTNGMMSAVQGLPEGTIFYINKLQDSAGRVINSNRKFTVIKGDYK